MSMLQVFVCMIVMCGGFLILPYEANSDQRINIGVQLFGAFVVVVTVIRLLGYATGVWP